MTDDQLVDRALILLDERGESEQDPVAFTQALEEAKELEVCEWLEGRGVLSGVKIG